MAQPQRTRNQDQDVRKSQGQRQFPSAAAGSTLDQPAEEPRHKRIAPKIAARRPQKVRNVCGASAKHRQARRPFEEVERLAQKSAPPAQRRAAQEHGERLARQRHRSEGQWNSELREASRKQAKRRHPYEVESQAAPLKPIDNQDVGFRARHSKTRRQETGDRRQKVEVRS